MPRHSTAISQFNDVHEPGQLQRATVGRMSFMVSPVSISAGNPNSNNLTNEHIDMWKELQSAWSICSTTRLHKVNSTPQTARYRIGVPIRTFRLVENLPQHVIQRSFVPTSIGVALRGADCKRCARPRLVQPHVVSTPTFRRIITGNLVLTVPDESERSPPSPFFLNSIMDEDRSRHTRFCVCLRFGQGCRACLERSDHSSAVAGWPSSPSAAAWGVRT